MFTHRAGRGPLLTPGRLTQSFRGQGVEGQTASAITRAIDVPLTLDMERGFGNTPEEVAAAVTSVAPGRRGPPPRPCTRMRHGWRAVS
jgi:hypothetical protein